jgi:hypothetical protein
VINAGAVTLARWPATLYLNVMVRAFSSPPQIMLLFRLHSRLGPATSGTNPRAVLCSERRPGGADGVLQMTASGISACF